MKQNENELTFLFGFKLVILLFAPNLVYLFIYYINNYL
jgi:hypothetical protein